MGKTFGSVSYSLSQLRASNDIAMLTASHRKNRLLLDFRSHNDEFALYPEDRGVLLLSGEYHAQVGDVAFTLAPYEAMGYATAQYQTDPFYMRVPAGKAASIRGNGIYQHVTSGPREQYHAMQAPELVSELAPLRMIRTSEEAFHSSDAVVTVGHREIGVLKAELPNTARKRIRLCCHRNSSESLHEMFVLYTKSTYIQPNKHLAKDETFLILEGEADFVFYSEAGDVTEIIPLGAPGSGKDFFVRVPEGRYHSVVMWSDYLVIHESTPGPYDREHTVWAPWAKSQRLN